MKPATLHLRHIVKPVNQPTTEDLCAWLTAKRQILVANRELERLDHVRQWLLNHDECDAIASEWGLEITRPDRTQYHFTNDPKLAKLLERQEQLSAQVRDLQKDFRAQCLVGLREIDADFMPARQVTVQLRRL
jgi:hypothetical protein